MTHRLRLVRTCAPAVAHGQTDGSISCFNLCLTCCPSDQPMSQPLFDMWFIRDNRQDNCRWTCDLTVDGSDTDTVPHTPRQNNETANVWDDCRAGVLVTSPAGWADFLIISLRAGTSEVRLSGDLGVGRKSWQVGEAKNPNLFFDIFLCHGTFVYAMAHFFVP